MTVGKVLEDLQAADGVEVACDGKSVVRDSSTMARVECPGPWLSAANRLAFGVNAAHPFVQFYVEARASLDIRVFSGFAWLMQLFGMVFFSVLVAIVAFVLVQRPWARLLSACLDSALSVMAIAPKCRHLSSAVELATTRAQDADNALASPGLQQDEREAEGMPQLPKRRPGRSGARR